jgi:hypothetical protein
LRSQRPAQNLDSSTQRPNGMSKPLLKALGRMFERVVLRIFDFIVVTHHVADSETASTAQDFLFSIEPAQLNYSCFYLALLIGE